MVLVLMNNIQIKFLFRSNGCMVRTNIKEVVSAWQFVVKLQNGTTEKFVSKVNGKRFNFFGLFTLSPDKRKGIGFTMNSKSLIILNADDDADDQLMIKKAFEKNNLNSNVYYQTSQ